MYNHEKGTCEYSKTLVNNLNFNILEQNHFYGNQNWKHYNINSPFNRLYFIINGHGYIENSFHKVVLEPGKMYLIPLNTTYNYICDNYIEKFYLHFHIGFSTGWDVFEGAAACIPLPYEITEVEKIIEKSESNNICELLYYKAFIFNTICKFAKEIHGLRNEQHENFFKYQNVYTYISNNCFATTTPKCISEHTGIPLSKLLYCIKNDTGHTLKDIIDRAVLQAGKEKVVLTDLSIKEIAYTLKFNDEFYFSRFFKKYTGISPLKYRILNKINP